VAGKLAKACDAPLPEVRHRRPAAKGETMGPRVLVTGVGSAAGRALAAQLSARGIPVLGADASGAAGPAGTEVVRIPPAGDPGWIPALRRLIDARSLNVVIPTRSEELPPLAAARAGFAEGIRLIVADPGPVAVAVDGLFTAWTLQAAGIPVPRFGVPSDFAAAPASLAALAGPVVVKARLAHAGQGVRILAETGAVDWGLLPDGQLVQEFIPGAGYCAMVFGTPARNAMAPTAVVVEEPRPGSPGAGSASRRLAAGEGADIGKLALAAVRVLGLAGPADVDIRRRADGTPVVLGVHPHFGASTASAPELLDAVLATFLLPSFNPASFRRCPAAHAHALG
jgi:carbamoylphosphate synthase large subunit